MMGPVDYNVARAAEVEAEEASLLRRFGRTSRGGAGTAARPMTRPVTQYQKTMVVEGKLRVSVKTRLGKLLAKSVLRRSRPRRVDESMEFGREVADLRLRLGLDEEEEMTKGKAVDRDQVLALIPTWAEAPTTSAALVEKSGLSKAAIQRVLHDLVDEGVIVRTLGKPGGTGGRAPGLYKHAGGRKVQASRATRPAPRLPDDVSTGFDLELDQILTPLREQLQQLIERKVEAGMKDRLRKIREALGDGDDDAG